jgi:hypothetical protein
MVKVNSIISIKQGVFSTKLPNFKLKIVHTLLFSCNFNNFNNNLKQYRLIWLQSKQSNRFKYVNLLQTASKMTKKRLIV